MDKTTNKSMVITILLLIVILMGLYISILQHRIKGFNEQLLILRNEQKVLEKKLEVYESGTPTKSTKLTLDVVVANKDIEAGSAIRLEDLEVQKWPIPSVPVDAFDYRGPIVGRIANKNILKNEAIVSRSLKQLK